MTDGSEQPLTLAELDALFADDRRLHDRVDHRTRAQVICLRADRPTIRSDVSMVGTEDVSVAGAKLLSSHPILADRIWVRFAGTTQGGAFIECHVRWRANESSGPPTKRHRCGVRFRRHLSREEFERVLGAGAGAH